MDISNLTSLINALRAETQEDSITPESLGALLQKIVDVLGSAASNLTVQQLVQWQQVAGLRHWKGNPQRQLRG